MNDDDPIQQAVNDYLLMERKARAWDKLELWARLGDKEVFDYMQELVHPAQDRSG